MRDANGAAVYVGKASNLRARVGSYFRGADRARREDRAHPGGGLARRDRGDRLGARRAARGTARDPRASAGDQHPVRRARAARRRRKRRAPGPPDPARARGGARSEVFLLHGDRAMRRAKRPARESRSGCGRCSRNSSSAPQARPSPRAKRSRRSCRSRWSWLDRNADRVNALDVDLAGGLDGALALLDRYLREPPECREGVSRVI